MPPIMPMPPLNMPGFAFCSGVKRAAPQAKMLETADRIRFTSDSTRHANLFPMG
jgi:hypothetical protein